MACDTLPDSVQQLTYDSLASASSIRLLKTHASDDFDAQIHGTLTMVDLDHHECPPFTALSYEWGSPLEISSIIINDGLISIRNNLFNFLHHYREATGPSKEANKHRLQRMREDNGLWHPRVENGDQYVWIDQVCINQTSNLERNHQVQVMSRIYSQAHYVLAWLGKSASTQWYL